MAGIELTATHSSRSNRVMSPVVSYACRRLYLLRTISHWTQFCCTTRKYAEQVTEWSLCGGWYISSTTEHVSGPELGRCGISEIQSGEVNVPSAPLDHLSIHATAAAEFCVTYSERSAEITSYLEN